MKQKFCAILIMGLMLISILPLNFVILTAYASVGSPSSDVAQQQSSGVSAEMYNGVPRNRQYYEENGYLYTYNFWGNTFNAASTRYSDDYGDTWGDAGGYFSGCDYDHAPFGSGWVDVAFDHDLGVAHVAAGFISSSQFPYQLDYSWGDPNDAGVWNDYSYSGAFNVELESQNEVDMSPSICLLDGKPVVACGTDDGNNYLKFWFSDNVKPYAIGNFTEVSYDYEAYFGDHSYFTHLHPVNATHVLCLIERTDSYRVFGIYASASGAGAPFEIIDEELNTWQINNYSAGMMNTVSEHYLNSNAYAENIGIAFINQSHYVKFAIFEVATNTLSDYEDVYDDSGHYDPGFPTLGMDRASYFLGWNGNRTSYTNTDFFISERSPSTKTWKTTHIRNWAINTQYYLLGASMSKSTFDGKFHCGWMDGSMDYWAFYVPAKGGFYVYADLEDVDDDGADWVFTDWKYYTFYVETALSDYDNISISFTVPCGEEKVNCGFWSDGYNWFSHSNMSYQSREGEPCNLQVGVWNETSGIMTFKIWFNSRILDVWDPNSGIDVYGQIEAGEWFLAAPNLFRVYTKGGFTLNYASSDESRAYILGGVSPFSFHAENGSNVYNEIWYRDVQHIKLLPDVYFIAGKEKWTMKYGCDYSLGDGEWITGFWMNIQPDLVAYSGTFASNIWINMTVTFNDAEEIARVFDSVYMYYHGSVDSAGDRGWFKHWVDLWFTDKNASSIAAARINAYEYPMVDEADLWLRWMASNWGVKDTVLKELGSDHPLLDADLNSVNSEQIKMVRYWCNLTVGDADAGQIIEIHNYDVFDATHSKQLPMTGISTPVFDETLIPTVGQKGMLGALFSMFSGFGQWISENVMFGGLNLWSNFVNFLDTVAAWFGAPKFFTNLFNWLAQLFGYMGEAAGYLLSITSDFFSLLGSLMAVFLTTMGDVISAFVNTITMITDMMGGAYGVGANLWEDLGISTWLSVLIILYPLYLVILWDQEGMDAVIKQLTLIFGILNWVFHFTVSVIQFILSIVESSVESVPVVE